MTEPVSQIFLLRHRIKEIGEHVGRLAQAPGLSFDETYRLTTAARLLNDIQDMLGGVTVAEIPEPIN